MSTYEEFVRTDNDRVRVSEFRLGQGASTGRRLSPFDHVVVLLSGGMIRALAGPDETLAEAFPGLVYFRQAGIAHGIVNAGKSPVAFAEILLKIKQRSLASLLRNLRGQGVSRWIGHVDLVYGAREGMSAVNRDVRDWAVGNKRNGEIE